MIAKRVRAGQTDTGMLAQVLWLKQTRARSGMRSWLASPDALSRHR